MKLFKKLKSEYIELVPEDGGQRSPVTRYSTLQNRFAVLGDIHANLEALNAVLADARAQGVSRFFCTGDVVGYGANPSECIQIIRELNCPVVQGNHDLYAATDESLKDFSLHAMNAILWTRGLLSVEERAWLDALPLESECRLSNTEQGMKKDAVRSASAIEIPCSVFCDSVRLVHASLNQPGRWSYIMKPEKAEVALRVQEPDLVFFGHTHVPTLYSFNPKTEEFCEQFPLEEGVHSLREGWKHLVNPGSVGQPRDRDPRASYALYDSQDGTVEIRRVAYDVESAAKKIESAELPHRNADRLFSGR